MLSKKNVLTSTNYCDKYHILYFYEVATPFSKCWYNY